MAEDMIERVARAMASADDEDYMGCAREYDRRARAAIEAMREPTVAMTTAGKHGVKGCDSIYEREIAETAYACMIQAALSGDPQ